MSDLTIIYTTANKVPYEFGQEVRDTLLLAVGKDYPIVTVSKKIENHPIFAMTSNLVFDTPSTHVNIYREVLAGAKAAKTRYIAIAEDDVLYSPEHFKKRPTMAGRFAYNVACWSIYTWSKEPIFSYSGRRNLGQLICERDLFIEAMEERFAKFTDDLDINNAIWAEPGKYESQLGVTVRNTELFYTDPANVMFTHPEGLSYHTLGEKKRLAPIRAYEIPHWGRAGDIVKLYE
jgi:hypothetical protein